MILILILIIMIIIMVLGSRIAETSVAGVYQLELERLAKCGVRTIFLGQLFEELFNYLF